MTDDLEQDKNVDTLSAVVYRSLETIDNMSPEMRACVHELGWEAVAIMRQYRLNPSAMRTICYACWAAPRSARQQPPSRKGSTRSSSVLGHLDTLLSRAGASISAVMLLAFLKRNGMVIVPYQASAPMVEASMATVTVYDPTVTKAEKHKRRLDAALMASARRLWPSVFPMDDPDALQGDAA